MKVDVEGAEGLVLKGGAHALADQQIDMIQFEWAGHQIDICDDATSPTEVLREAGYSWFRPDIDGNLKLLAGPVTVGKDMTDPRRVRVIGVVLASDRQVALIAGGAVDRLAQQIGVAAMAGILLDHVDDRPSEGVVACLWFTGIAVVHARRGEMGVDDGDLAPINVQCIGDGRIRWHAPLLVVIEERRDVVGK